LVCMRYHSAYILIFSADIVATPVLDAGLKPVKGDFYAISGWRNALRIIADFPAVRPIADAYPLKPLLIFIGEIGGCCPILSVDGLFAVYPKFVGLCAHDIELGKVSKHVSVPLALEMCLEIVCAPPLLINYDPSRMIQIGRPKIVDAAFFGVCPFYEFLAFDQGLVPHLGGEFYDT
jgi:hypothetical protein